MITYFHKFLTALISLLKGMGLTFGYLIHPSRVVTQQYPENRDSLQMLPRFRGQLAMIHNDSGAHNCTACSLCEKACPNGSISILATKNRAGTRVLGQYIYRYSQCTLCNLCVEACPFGAIRMAQEYEFAYYDRQSMDLILNQEEGAADG